jgi:hypothetical protein
MVPYLLFCILCVLLAPYIGGMYAIAMWALGTIAIGLARAFDGFERWIAKRKP